MHFLAARQGFTQEINQRNKQINLAKAALYIAQEEYPDLEIDDYLNALDTMAVEIKERLPSQQYPLRIIQTINQYLYEDLGFTGNEVNYYDPRNSFLNDVIDRRTGIPITLSLIYLEIAKRLEFPMVGIGMPGHFLIRPDFDEVGIYVDVFNQGEILFTQDCEAKLSQIYHQPVELHPSFLVPVENRRFLARILTNLKFIYLNEHQDLKALGTIDRLLLLFPDTPIELRDRGLVYYQLKRWRESRQDLKEYLCHRPQAEDAVIIRQILGQIEESL